MILGEVKRKSKERIGLAVTLQSRVATLTRLGSPNRTMEGEALETLRLHTESSV
jgi:hypothetical protein